MVVTIRSDCCLPDYTAELSFGSLKMKQNFHVDLAEGIAPR